MALIGEGFMCFCFGPQMNADERGCDQERDIKEPCLICGNLRLSAAQPYLIAASPIPARDREALAVRDRCDLVCRFRAERNEGARLGWIVIV